jgi:hypothetical protein
MVRSSYPDWYMVLVQQLGRGFAFTNALLPSLVPQGNDVDGKAGELSSFTLGREELRFIFVYCFKGGKIDFWLRVSEVSVHHGFLHFTLTFHLPLGGVVLPTLGQGGRQIFPSQLILSGNALTDTLLGVLHQPSTSQSNQIDWFLS